MQLYCRNSATANQRQQARPELAHARAGRARHWTTPPSRSAKLSSSPRYAGLPTRWSVQSLIETVPSWRRCHIKVTLLPELATRACYSLYRSLFARRRSGSLRTNIFSKKLFPSCVSSLGSNLLVQILSTRLGLCAMCHFLAAHIVKYPTACFSGGRDM